MKNTIAILIVCTLLLSLFTGCAGGEPTPAAQPETAAPAGERPAETGTEVPETEPGEEPAIRLFTDSLGRTVELPAQIEKLAVTGPVAQYVLFALCPERLVGISTAWDASAEELLAPEYLELPVIGQLYGGKSEMNPETLLTAGAQLVIDVGEPKGSAAADLDALSEQTGIPFVHVTAYLSTMGDAFRMLGELLALPEQAETLALWCDSVYARSVVLASSAEKPKALFVTGTEGHSVIALDSYHSEVFDLFTDNLAVVEEPSSKGLGNEVDPEQLLVWNPDLIIFSPESVYASAGSDPFWQNISAVQTDNYYEVPFGPCNWMGFPPSVYRYLGLLWLGALLYPDSCGYDLYESVAEYDSLFFHCELTREQFDTMTSRSLNPMK